MGARELLRYNTMIAVCAQDRDADGAVGVFRDLTVAGVKPTERTFGGGMHNRARFRMHTWVHNRWLARALGRRAMEC